MIVRQRFDGRDHPFEGERRLTLGSLPEGAKVLHARAVVTPVLAEDGGPPVETLAFAGESWGATRVRQGDVAEGGPPGWVEVDFHTRRTLHSVRGTALDGATLEIDLGGAFAGVRRNGTLLAPGDPTSEVLALSADDELVPGLTVARFRLTRDGASPSLTHVRVRGVPRNVSLGLGAEPAFFNHPGELTRAAAIDDFTAVLTAFLDGDEPVDGFHRVPLVLRSDALGRVDVEVEIDLLVEQSVLPPGLDEVTVPYAYGALPETGPGVLEVAVPPGMRVRAAEGRVVGAFEDSRVVLGPVGELSAEPSSVPLTPDRAQAQRLVLAERLEASAVDLLLAAVSRRARLELDLLVDLDGRPGGGSLLSRPVAFTLERETAGTPTWVSVPLGAAVQLEAHDPERSWLAVKVLEGEALWFVGGDGEPGAGELRSTDDGGLSWRRSEAAGVAAPAGLFRLRHRPETFRMPVELQVGTGDTARRVSFAAQEPRGRLEIDLGVPEVAGAFDAVLAAGGAGAEGEALDNPGFESWSAVGDALGAPTRVALGVLPTGPSLVAPSPDGGRAFVVTGGSDEASTFRVVDLVCGGVEGPVDLDTVAPVGLAAHPAGRRVYVALPRALYVLDVDQPGVVGSVELRARTITALALSPDGEELFLGSRTVGTAVARASRIDRVSTERLEAVALAGGPDAARDLFTGPGVRSADLARPALSLAVSPDGARLVALVGGDVVFDVPEAGTGRRLESFDAPTLAPLVRAMEVDPGTETLALSAGRLVTVETDALVLRDPATLVILGRVPLPQGSGSIALAPDGRRAYVAGAEGGSGVDLERRRRVTGLAFRSSVVSDVAVTPDGGYLLVTHVFDGLPGALDVVPIGSHLPDEWAVTGPVFRACLPEVEGSVLGIGAVSVSARRREGREVPSTEGPFGLSQVAPVAGGSRYELAFEGLASVEDARVELSWIADGCGRLDTLSLPVPSIEAGARALGRVQLVATAPPGARQAEVRLRLPEGAAAVRRISLMATAERLENGRFQVGPDGVPVGWELTPAAGSGLAVSAGSDGRVRLASAVAPVSLAQTLEVEGGQLYDLTVAGSTAAGPAPELRVRWATANGEVAASALGLPLGGAARAGSGSGDPARARGRVPEGAVVAHLELRLPAGSSLVLERISLDLRTPQRVPVVFVAEAPGELRIRDWRVAYEPAEPAPAPRPEGGFCAPTPPDLEAGEACDDEPACQHCKAAEGVSDAETGVTVAGRAVTVGSCTGCGAPRITFTAGPAPRADRFVPRSLPSPRARGGEGALRLAPASERLFEAAERVTAPPEAQEVPLTAVVGIGEKRAADLESLGIDSIEKLAAADPARLEGRVPGAARPLIEDLIAQARRLGG